MSEEYRKSVTITLSDIAATPAWCNATNPTR